MNADQIIAEAEAYANQVPEYRAQRIEGYYVGVIRRLCAGYEPGDYTVTVNGYTLQVWASYEESDPGEYDWHVSAVCLDGADITDFAPKGAIVRELERMQEEEKWAA